MKIDIDWFFSVSKNVCSNRVTFPVYLLGRPMAEPEAFKMHILLLWDDTAANRIVKFSVEYSIEANTLHVFEVKPMEVSLLDLQWNTVVTRMKVRSIRTYELLRTRFLASGGLDALVNKIAKHHDLTVVSQ